MSTETRRGVPNARYTTTDTDGSLIKLRTDELGVVKITTDAERRAADAFGLPITKLPKRTEES